MCGSDGKTHDSECKLRAESCRRAIPIEVVERRPCTGCANVTCHFYSVCSGSLEKPGVGVCSCPASCDQLHAHDELIEGIVCGTDGRTYDNECQLKMEACTRQQHVVVANEGDCDLCRDVKCQHGARCEAGQCVCPTECPPAFGESSAVCGTDGLIYPNECEMLKRSCEVGYDISVLHHGYCEDSKPEAELEKEEDEGKTRKCILMSLF